MITVRSVRTKIIKLEVDPTTARLISWAITLAVKGDNNCSISFNAREAKTLAAVTTKLWETLSLDDLKGLLKKS